MIGSDIIRVSPPGKGKCPVCACKHAEGKAHAIGSVYYQYHFWKKNKRFPTPEDAAKDGKQKD